MTNLLRAVGKVVGLAWKAVYRFGTSLLLLAAGIVGLIAPPPALEEVNNVYIRATWAGCLILGGAVCTWGIWRFTYRPQIIGSLFLAAGIVVYAIALTPVWPVSAVVILIFTSHAQHLVTRSYQLKVTDDAGIPGGREFAGWASALVGRRLSDGASSDGGSSRYRRGALAEGEHEGDQADRPA